MTASPARHVMPDGRVLYFGPDGLPLDTFTVSAEDLPRVLAHVKLAQLDDRQARAQLLSALVEGEAGMASFDEEALESEVYHLLGWEVEEDPELDERGCVGMEWFVQPVPHPQLPGLLAGRRMFRVHGDVAHVMSGYGYGKFETHDAVEVVHV